MAEKTRRGDRGSFGQASQLRLVLLAALLLLAACSAPPPAPPPSPSPSVNPETAGLPRPEGPAKRLREAEAALAAYEQDGDRRHLEQAEPILQDLEHDKQGLPLQFFPRLYLTFVHESLDRPGHRLKDLNEGQVAMYRFVFDNPQRPALEFLKARTESVSDYAVPQVYAQIGGGTFNTGREEENAQFLSRLGPLEGKVAADLGGGLGLLAWQLADAVGPAGRVYLAELDPSLKTFLDFTATLEPWSRLAGRVRFLQVPSPRDPGLPEPLDVLTMQEVHVLCDGPYEKDGGRDLLPRLFQAVKPGGVVGVFEGFRKDVTPERAAARMEGAGFRVRETEVIRSGEGFILVAERPKK